MATINFGGYTLPVYDPATLTWTDPTKQTTYYDNGQVMSDGYTAPSLAFGGQYDPAIGMYSNRDNWLLEPGMGGMFTPGSRDTFTGMLKVGDKEGARFRYALQDGKYVPVEFLGNEAWDTNSRMLSQFALAAAAITGGGLAAEAFGLGGGAGATTPSLTTYGVLDASAALPGTTFNPATVGSFAGIPSAGFEIAGPGANALSEATKWAANGLPAGATPGMLDGLTEALKGTGLSDSLVKQLAPSLLKFGMGIYGKNQGDKYVDQLFDQEAQAAGAYRDAWTQYASGLEGLFAPTAGRYGAMRDNYLGAAEGMFGQLKDFNPQTFATDRYRAMQDLIAPTRALEQQGLMQDLFTKGGFGLTVNTPGSAGGVAGINPYVDTLVNRWGQQDKQMAYDSLAQGESFLDNLIRRQAGMFGEGVGADAIGVGRGDRVLSANRDATTRYIEAMLRAQAGRTGANAASSAELTDGLGGVIENLPWGTIWDKLGGIFGSN